MIINNVQILDVRFQIKVTKEGVNVQVVRSHIEPVSNET